MAENISSSLELQQECLHPRFRLDAVILAACVLGTCWWWAYMESGWQRLLIGVVTLAWTLIVPLAIRREQAAAQNSLKATATITGYRRGAGRYRSGARIKYVFLTSAGAEFNGESFWNVRGVERVGKVTVFYNALDPSRNLPICGFLSHDFRNCYNLNPTAEKQR